MKNEHVIIYRAKQRGIFSLINEAYKTRALVKLLAIRDIKSKYAQTSLGVLWVIINPLLTVLILSFIFGLVVKSDTNGFPQFLFTAVGLLGWNYFSNAVQEGGNSIINSYDLVTKVYFPRIILPVSKAYSALVDFFIFFIFCLILVLIYKLNFSLNILFLPLYFFLLLLLSTSIGILFSSLIIRFRDLRFVTPVITRIGLYLTPIAYSTQSVPEKFQMIYALNPMVGITEGIRWSLIGGNLDMNIIYIAVLMTGIICLLSLYTFSKIQDKIADII